MYPIQKLEQADTAEDAGQATLSLQLALRSKTPQRNSESIEQPQIVVQAPQQEEIAPDENGKRLDVPPFS